NISLKDFRTLLASASVLESLARIKPATSSRLRRKQVLQAVSATADELANTPTICRKSYVHDAVINAFEQGILERFSRTLKNCRSPSRRAKGLAEVIPSASRFPAGAGGAVRGLRAAMSLVPVSGLCGIVRLLRGPRNFFLRTWFTTSSLSLYERISHGDTQQCPKCRRRCPGQGTRGRRGGERSSRQRRGCH